ncbi:MAG: SPFH domain-containing protein [Blautia sp.]|nr:SPFH domain-containing protein [Blautia sp.]
MGLIKAIVGAASSTLEDQWKEFIYCESLPANVLVRKGKNRNGKRGSSNIISDGSVIAVNDGQCMIIVEQGKVVDLCAEPGEYKYDSTTSPSLFTGDLGEGIKNVFAEIGKRFTFGGQAAADQRVYYVNTKELTGNKYGTPNPVPFRVVDQNIGLDMDISIRCFGEYSYRIANPILFYTNVCGNVEEDFVRESIDGQLKSELMTALQPAFAKISDMGIRYSSLPGHTTELSEVLNQVLSEKWDSLRGIQVVSLGVSSVKASEEDEKAIKELQRNATFRNPNMAAAQLVGAQAAAMQAAASNQNAGPTMAFAGMNMAANAGGLDAQTLFNMGAQQNAPQQIRPQASADSWTCSCGAVNTGKFCSECGSAKPAPGVWTCSNCGTENTGKFCAECGSPKPAAPGVWTCSNCGTENTAKFCSECGSPRE